MLIGMAVHDTEENNRTWMTKATLESLLETVDWSKHRLFVVDNGSCLATKRLYMSFATRFPTGSYYPTDNKTNLGTAKAINKAWRHRDFDEHTIKIDNDVVIYQPGWVDQMEDVFDRDPSIGIVALKRKDLVDAGVIRMLPHEHGQPWLVVEEVECPIGTCQAYSSALLDKIGYLTQPGVYGYDDALASLRAKLAGFKCVFLPGIEIEHIDPGGDEYCQWKIAQASRYRPAFNTQQLLYQAGAKGVYYDGGFDQ